MSLGGTPSGYDAKGHVTSDGTRTFGYSSKNLLTSGAEASPATIRCFGSTRWRGSTTTARFAYGGGSCTGREWTSRWFATKARDARAATAAGRGARGGGR